MVITMMDVFIYSVMAGMAGAAGGMGMCWWGF
jgi:hypothetical protein